MISALVISALADCCTSTVVHECWTVKSVIYRRNCVYMADFSFVVYAVLLCVVHLHHITGGYIVKYCSECEL